MLGMRLRIIFPAIFDDVRQDGSDYCEDHRDHDGVVLL